MDLGMKVTYLLLSSLVTNLRNSVEKDVLDVPSCLGKASRRKSSLFLLFSQL